MFTRRVLCGIFASTGASGAADLSSAVFRANRHIKPRLDARCGVANLRNSDGYCCGLRLAPDANPSVLFSADQHETMH